MSVCPGWHVQPPHGEKVGLPIPSLLFASAQPFYCCIASFVCLFTRSWSFLSTLSFLSTFV